MDVYVIITSGLYWYIISIIHYFENDMKSLTICITLGVLTLLHVFQRYSTLLDQKYI